jgi:hypothetical protein
VFEDREPSIFPHPLSAWWIPILLGLIFGTGFLLDILFSNDEGTAAAFVPPAFLLFWTVVLVLVPIQAFRLLMYFVNRAPPSPKSK